MITCIYPQRNNPLWINLFFMIIYYRSVKSVAKHFEKGEITIMNEKETLNKIRETMRDHEGELAEKYSKAKENYLKALHLYDKYLEYEKEILKKYLEYIDADTAGDDVKKAKIVKEEISTYNKVKNFL